MGCICASQKNILLQNEISLTPIPESSRKEKLNSIEEKNKININSNNDTRYKIRLKKVK